MQTLRAPISKNISELLVLKVVIYCMLQNYSGSRLAFQIRLLSLLKHKITIFYLLWFACICFGTRCHSLSFFITDCHSLSFAVTCCTTSCHSLATRCITRCHSLFDSMRCTTRCHSLSVVVIRCSTCCHSFSLVVIRCHSMYHSSVFL